MLHILLLKENGKHSRMSIIPGYLAVPDISIGVLQYNSASDFVLVVALKNNDVFFKLIIGHIDSKVTVKNLFGKCS